jgi:hypothetical protein
MSDLVSADPSGAEATIDKGEVSRPAGKVGLRDLTVKCALWLLGTFMVGVAVWPTMSVPVQADDMLTLFNLGSANRDGLLHLATATMDRSMSSFIDGETSHFFPIGLTLEVTLKGAMLRASAHGATASGIHHVVFLLFAIGTYVSSTLLVAGLRRAERTSRFGAAIFAVPVALGFAVAVQVTTLWSTYDPLVSHPVFGGFVTLVGVTYLMLVTYALQPPSRWYYVVASALLSVLGVAVYEGFYAFVAIAMLMVFARVMLGPRAQWRKAVLLGLWAVGPGFALIVGARLWSARASVSTYGGTEVDLSLTTVVSWVTSMQTTAPGSTWANTMRSVPADRFDYVTSQALLGGIGAIAAISAWLLAARRLDRSSMRSTPRTHAPHVSLEWLVPVAGMLLLGPLVFAVSTQWAAYYLTDGVTYMSATTSYWAWAMMIGIGLDRLAGMRSRLLLGTVLSLVLAFAGVQQLLNGSAVALEVEHPTPFGVDLVKILDDGTPLDEAGRCALLTGVPQSQEIPGWLDTLNRQYASRHGVAFCR